MTVANEINQSTPDAATTSRMEFPSPAGNIRPKRKFSKQEVRDAKFQGAAEHLPIDGTKKFKPYFEGSSSILTWVICFLVFLRTFEFPIS